MSDRLAMQVFESDLPAALKPTMVVMALFDHGKGIFPSVDRVAFLRGVSRRQVARELSALRALGVLVPLTPMTGGRLASGRGRSVVYEIALHALPPRSPFRPPNHDAGVRVNPDVNGRVPAGSTLTPEVRTMTSAVPNPDIRGAYPDVHVIRSERRSTKKELREGIEREDLPHAARAADSLKENGKSTEKASGSQPIFRCDDCDWSGVPRDSAKHYHETRHQLARVAP